MVSGRYRGCISENGITNGFLALKATLNVIAVGKINQRRVADNHNAHPATDIAAVIFQVALDS